LAGTILNVWAGVDAASHVNISFVYEDGTRLDVFKPPTPANAYAYLDPHDKYNQWREALATYRGYQLRAWERPAKIEFALLAGAVCAWLILPAAATRGEPGR
jgi:hypothetical protein